MNSGGHDFLTYCAPLCARVGVELEDQVVLIVGQFGTMHVATAVDFPCRFPLRGGRETFQNMGDSTWAQVHNIVQHGFRVLGLWEYFFQKMYI